MVLIGTRGSKRAQLHRLGTFGSTTFFIHFFGFFRLFWAFFGPLSIFSYIFLASAFHFHAPGASLAPIGLRWGSLESSFAFFSLFLYIRKCINMYTEIHENSSGGPPIDVAFAQLESACNFHVGYAFLKAPAWIFEKMSIFSYIFLHIYNNT